VRLANIQYTKHSQKPKLEPKPPTKYEILTDQIAWIQNDFSAPVRSESPHKKYLKQVRNWESNFSIKNAESAEGLTGPPCEDAARGKALTALEVRSYADSFKVKP
jgi:hypothetical protein